MSRFRRINRELFATTRTRQSDDGLRLFDAEFRQTSGAFDNLMAHPVISWFSNTLNTTDSDVYVQAEQCANLRTRFPVKTDLSLFEKSLKHILPRESGRLSWSGLSVS